MKTPMSKLAVLCALTGLVIGVGLPAHAVTGSAKLKNSGCTLRLEKLKRVSDSEAKARYVRGTVNVHCRRAWDEANVTVKIWGQGHKMSNALDVRDEYRWTIRGSAIHAGDNLYTHVFQCNHVGDRGNWYYPTNNLRMWSWAGVRPVTTNTFRGVAVQDDTHVKC
jgi:hypothetical protein